MPDNFLHLVAHDVLTRLNGRLENTVVVFPNKRPSGYFLKALESLDKYNGKPPSFYSIEDFIAENSTAKLAQPSELIFTLYKIYLKYYPGTELDAFYGWGNLMLNDFDEIDRYMADAGRLFRNLSAAKDIETYFMKDFALPDEFLKPLNPDDEYYLQQKFIEIWQVYEKCYHDLKAELRKQNLAYNGMNFREVANGFISGKILPTAEKYIFIGFNALSTSEEQLIQHLLNQDKALIYWDADDYFLRNDLENAGYFIRRHMSRIKGYNKQVTTNLLQSGSKNIHIIGAPLLVGQAKTLGTLIKKNKHDQDGTTAIVLADENLLVPVLYALPYRSDELNVTPGFPLHTSGIYTLIKSIFSLHKNYRPATGSFYHKDVIEILSHPLVRNAHELVLAEFTEKIMLNQWIFVNKPELEKIAIDWIPIIFKEITNTGELSNLLFEVIQKIKQQDILIESKDIRAAASFESIILELSAIVEGSDIVISPKSFEKLFKEKVYKEKISFSEDNIDMLQVMGMLETRCLDFETVYISSVNESILPAGGKSPSYIPFDLRKEYGLPTIDEQEHLYAYNFYRLLQRADNIYLLYDSETGSGGNEKSRYLRQIEQFFPDQNPNIHVEIQNYALPLRNQPTKEIIIPKDEKYFKALEKKNETGFSPSFINSYYLCPLQFYFQHILGIPQKEIVTEDLEARHFGTLFHALMEKSYEGLKGEMVTREILASRKDKLTINLGITLEKLHSQKDNILEKNSLLVETVKILAEKALEADMDHAPFKLLEMEQTLHHNIDFNSNGFNQVHLKGQIDRIDEKDGITRIVDYKTGSVKQLEFNFRDPEEVLSKDNKEAFQTLYYSFLYLKNNPGSKLKPALLPLKDVVNGYKNVNENDGILSESDFNLYEEKLKSTILAILDPETPIIQSDDTHLCANCSYKNICLR
jgi:CRISPR/Cas system-associated exonuclease Cas4 (RecB family)